MIRSEMIATAWSNGKHGNVRTTYGLKLRADDRDRYFNPKWTSVDLVLHGQHKLVAANISKRSFWDQRCRELISAEIGRWLQKNGKAPWAKGHPSKVRIKLLRGNRFSVRL